jgi:hypothetical protein
LPLPSVIAVRAARAAGPFSPFQRRFSPVQQHSGGNRFNSGHVSRQDRWHMHQHFKKLAGALAAVALAAGLTIAGTGTARADVVPSSSWNEIIAPEINSNGNIMCADDPGWSVAEYQPLQLWHCHGYASNGQPQRWRFQYVGHNDTAMYQIFLQDVGCISLDARITDYAKWQGSNIVMDHCYTNGGVLNWNLRPATQSPDPNNQFEITSAYVPVGSRPYCVAANTFLDVNGNRLIAEPCDPYNSSQWFTLG